MDEGLIMTIWDTFREYIPEKHLEVAAEQFVELLLDHDTPLLVLESLKGYDPHLDDAIKVVTDEDGDDEDEDDDGDSWGDEDEDEDY